MTVSRPVLPLRPGIRSIAILVVLLVSCSANAADLPTVRQQQDLPATSAGPGVMLRELIGRGTALDSRSRLASVAWFRLLPGHASAWSHNRRGEEAFLVLAGTGSVWIGNQSQPVGPGSYILVQPAMIRSIRADREQALEFYAITAPAWSRADDVLVAPPAGAPHSD